MKLKIFSCFIFSFFLLSLHAQNNLQFLNYSLDEGLSQNTIRYIIQDSRGFIWIATFDGLNRFDGYDFKVYRNNPEDSMSLRVNTILCLCIDSKDDLWIGTLGGGLHRYNERMDNFIYYDLDLEKDVIRHIYEDDENNLWLGTNSGLVLFNPEVNSFIKYQASPGNPYSLNSNILNCIIQDKYENFWIATIDGGLNIFNPSTKRFRRLSQNEENENYFPDNSINTLYYDGDSIILAGTLYNGLIKINIDRDSWKALPVEIDNFSSHFLSHHNVMTICPEEKNKYWVGTLGGGLALFDIEKGTFEHFINQNQVPSSLVKNDINYVFKDVSDNLWVGTEGGGISFYDRSRKKFKLLTHVPGNKQSLNNKSILSITEDIDGSIWFGTDGGGLTRYFRDEGKFIHYNSVPDNPKSLSYHKTCVTYKDNKGIIWIGTTSKGMDMFDRTSDGFNHYTSRMEGGLNNDRIFWIYEDSKQRFWIGTFGGGLNLFDRETGKARNFIKDENDPYSISNDYITHIIEDSLGNIWVATWEGLNMFDGKSNQFKRLLHDVEDKNSISNNEITCLLADSKNRLWIGTHGGLNIYDYKTGNFSVYKERDGLPNNVICGILEDDHHNLWISTYKGLCKMNPNELSFSTYNKDDGLQGNQFNMRACLKMKNGEMYFGGINGVTYFFPDSIKENSLKPKLQFTQFKLFNKPVFAGKDGSPLDNNIWETDTIQLKYYQSSFTLDYVGLTYSASSKCKYRYLLMGYETSWNYTDNRSVTYTNLPPGEYDFILNASGNDQNWESSEQKIHFTITPPYWQTLWFKIMIISLIILTTFGIHNYRLRSIKHQKRELDVKVKERTREVLEQKKEIETQAESLMKANQEIIAKNLTLEYQKEEIETQAKEIRRMNVLLRSKNIDLTKDVKEKSRALIMQKRVTFEEFREIYPDDDACLNFIKELKSEHEFNCPNCHNHDYYDLNGHYFRRCKKCGYRESITVNTIFNRLKFPIVKAFYILYLVSTGRELTVDELSKLIDLRRETCWAFRNKVMELMSTRKRFRNPREGWKELILLPEKYKKTHVL